MDGVLLKVAKLRHEEELVRAGVRRSSKWPAKRRQVLERFRACAVTGITTELEVHHIQPFHLFPELELVDYVKRVLTEHASFNAHFWIGHLGDWKSYNEHIKSDADWLLERILNRPFRKPPGRPR